MTNSLNAQSIEQNRGSIDANLGANIKHSAIINKFLAQNFSFRAKNMTNSKFLLVQRQVFCSYLTCTFLPPS